MTHFTDDWPNNMSSETLLLLLYERSYPLLDPLAGTFNNDYLHFLYVRVKGFDDEEALFCLRDNVWMTEGKLEIIREWESYEYRRNLIAEMIAKGVVFSTNPKDYFQTMHKPRLTPKFLATIKEYKSSTDEE